jgi:hypothetical protein
MKRHVPRVARPNLIERRMSRVLRELEAILTRTSNE